LYYQIGVTFVFKSHVLYTPLNNTIIECTCFKIQKTMLLRLY